MNPREGSPGPEPSLDSRCSRAGSHPTIPLMRWPGALLAWRPAHGLAGAQESVHVPTE